MLNIFELGEGGLCDYPLKGSEVEKKNVYNLPFKQAKKFANVNNIEFHPDYYITIGGKIETYLSISRGEIVNEEFNIELINEFNDV
ncbi:MAG: hypothetical protein ACFFD2_19525 [Promethearchaeota archaeon]